jgi:hypothetical protein
MTRASNDLPRSRDGVLEHVLGELAADVQVQLREAAARVVAEAQTQARAVLGEVAAEPVRQAREAVREAVGPIVTHARRQVVSQLATAEPSATSPPERRLVRPSRSRAVRIRTARGSPARKSGSADPDPDDVAKRTGQEWSPGRLLAAVLNYDHLSVVHRAEVAV